MKLSQQIAKLTQLPSDKDYVRWEENYIKRRLAGKKPHGYKKLMQQLYK